MNNKGQVMFFTLMIGIAVLVFVMALAFPVKEAVDNTTNYSGSANSDSWNGTTGTTTLDCNNASISIFNKGACIVADMSMFYFIGGLIFMVGGIIAAKVLL